MSDTLQRIPGDVSLSKFASNNYLGADLFDDGAEPVLTIAGFWQGTITLDNGRKEEHTVVRFVETDAPGLSDVKPLVLNATNRKALKKIYGSDLAKDLEGKKVQFYIDPKVRDPKNGGTTKGIRIRPFTPKAAEPVPPCADCGGVIAPSNGRSADWMAKYTTKNYGVALCAECAVKRKAEKEAAGNAD